MKIGTAKITGRSGAAGITARTPWGTTDPKEFWIQLRLMSFDCSVMGADKLPFCHKLLWMGWGGCFLAAGGRWRITAWKIWNPEPVISTSTLYWTMVTPNIIVKGCTSTSFMDIPSSMYPFSNGQTSSGLYFLLVVKILCRKLYRHPKFELFP